MQEGTSREGKETFRSFRTASALVRVAECIGIVRNLEQSMVRVLFCSNLDSAPIGNYTSDFSLLEGFW